MNKGSNISAAVYLLNCLVSGQTAQKYLNYGLLKYSDTLEYTSVIKTGSGFMLGGVIVWSERISTLAPTSDSLSLGWISTVYSTRS